MELKVKKVRENVPLPTRATAGSAGYDLCAAIENSVEIAFGSIVMVPTGIAMEIPAGYVGFVFIRSGVSSKHGLALINGVGVIDSDYRGEIMLPIVCNRPEGYTISPRERIAQIVITPFLSMDVVETEELSRTFRGENGFGSTTV